MADALDEIRERHAARCRYAPGLGADPADFRRLLAALEAVLKLHQPHVRRQNWPPVCSYDNRRWPCPEVEAITRALVP